MHSSGQDNTYLLYNFGQEEIGCWCLKTSVLDTVAVLEIDCKAVVFMYLCQLFLTIFRVTSLLRAHTTDKEVASF